MNQRFVKFDIAKAICMILVVIGHYVPGNAPSWYVMLHDWIYRFHMPVFMFASGYIYIAFKKEEGYGRFLWKKIRRLMGPYFVASIIIITIKLLTQKGMYVENPVEMSSYLRMLYLPEAGYFLWFIWALFIMFIIIPCFKNRLSRTIFFIFAVFWHYAHPVPLTQLFCISQASNMLIWFMLGVMCFDWKDLTHKIKFDITPAIKVFVLVVFVVSSLLDSYGLLNIDQERGGGKWFIIRLIPYAGIASVMVVSSWLERFTNRIFVKLLLAISESSYVIYLFHTTFEGFAKSIIHKFGMGGNDAPLFIADVIFVVSAGIVCPVILYQYVLNKHKVTKILFGLK